MRINNILKGLICPLLFSVVCVKAQNDFIEECLEVKDITTSCEVNSQGKINKIFLNLNSVTEKDVDKLLSYETITSLEIKGGVDSQKVVDKIASLKNLEILRVGELEKKDKNITFEPFKKLTKVESLRIWGDYIYGTKNFEKDILNKFENIKEFYISDAIFNQNDINVIGSYKNLKLFDTYNLKFEKNVDFSPFKNIEELAISGEYSDISKDYIKSFKNLKKLTLEGYLPNIDQSFIDEIANLSTIEELILQYSNPEIIANFNVLNKLKNLSALDLRSNCRTTKFIGFNSLKTLNLEGVYIDQDQINNIGKLPKLETLYITCTEDNSDLDYTPLKKIKSLSSLYFNGANDKYDHKKDLTKNTLKGFDYIKYLYLKRFDLKQSDIDDIATLTNLRVLEFDFCYLRGNINTLKKLPDLTIKNLDELHIYDEKISTNGKCGEEDGKCPDGECCSKYGYCGTSDKHCKSGCQSEFGECKVVTTTTTTTTTTKTSTKTSLPTSTNGRCGKSDGKCPSGKCCSKYGYCGTSDAHCKSGCQSEFGECKLTTTTTTTTKTKTSTKSSIPTSTNGKCGKSDGKCPSGKCCSKYGWCGTSDAHCGSGCQSEFGKCN